MKLTSKVKHLHMTPQKCRLVADLVRGVDVEKAEMQLKNIRKKAAEPILKLLNQAVASAEHNKDMDKSNLYINKIFIDEGTSMKRWQPRAFGRAYPILKRTSHITLELNEKVAGKKKAKDLKQGQKVENKEKKTTKKKEDNNKKFNKDNKDNNKPSKNGGVFKKMFRRKSV